MTNDSKWPRHHGHAIASDVTDAQPQVAGGDDKLKYLDEHHAIAQTQIGFAKYFLQQKRYPEALHALDTFCSQQDALILKFRPKLAQLMELTEPRHVPQPEAANVALDALLSDCHRVRQSICNEYDKETEPMAAMSRIESALRNTEMKGGNISARGTTYDIDED